MKLSLVIGGGVFLTGIAALPYVLGAADVLTDHGVSDQIAEMLAQPDSPQQERAVDTFKEWISALPAAWVALFGFVIWYRDYLGPPLRRILMIGLAILTRTWGLEHLFDTIRRSDHSKDHAHD